MLIVRLKENWQLKLKFWIRVQTWMHLQTDEKSFKNINIFNTIILIMLSHYIPKSSLFFYLFYHSTLIIKIIINPDQTPAFYT